MCINFQVDLRLKKEMREPPPGGKCNASLVNTTYGAYDEGSCILECKDRFVSINFNWFKVTDNEIWFSYFHK